MQRNARRAKPLVWLLVVPALAWCVSARAQAPSAQLHVATATGATTFHIGERISLQLDYTAKPEAHLAVTTKSYDRSGRMNVESFEVSPSSGFSDPLAAYFGGVMMMGGMFTVQELSGKPYTMHLDMNEWVRFDSPGDYTVTVHSTRVFSPEKSDLFIHGLTVTSNPIKLHILPATPEWQKATLDHAVQMLAVKRNPNGPVTEEIAGAIADVRYLGSAASIPVLVAGLGDDQTNKPFTFALGLIGLPPALDDLAHRAVRESIDDPDVAVSDFHFMAYAGLATSPASSPEEGVKARGAGYAEAMQLAIAALPNKRGKAKAATADVLLRHGPGGLTAEDKAVIARALASTFTDLPEDKQATLLGWQWDVVRSAVTPQTLEQIASLPVTDPASRVMPTYNRVQLKSEALSRLYELDPEAAKRLAYAQIGSATPSLTAARLWFLPAEPLPQYESIWAQALLSPQGESDPEVLAALMTRFGTGAFASQVAAKVRGALGEEACAPQAAMLGYVVKFNPDLARPLLQDAMGTRSHTACYRDLVNEVAGYATSSVLVDVAMEAVNDDDSQTVMGGLRYLMIRGDQRAQAVILKRYISWTQEWAGKDGELDSVSLFKPSPTGEQEQLGEMLGRALLVNQGWIADDNLRSEVLKRCVGERMCHALQQNYRAERPPHQVQLFQQGGQQNIGVGANEIPNLDLLKGKLSQYPRGTAFALIQPDSSADMQRFEKQVQEVFDDAGMTLTKKP